MVTPAASVTNNTLLFYGMPGLTGFTPDHGLPSNWVMISGSNFTGTSTVLFNGNAAGFVVTNNTRIGTQVPANAQAGPIAIVAPGGTNTGITPSTLDYTSDVSVSMSAAPAPVLIGSNLVYTLNVFNAGPYPAPNVTVTNSLPGSFALRASSTSQGSINTNDNPIIGLLGTINSGGSATVRLTVTSLAVGVATNSASIGSDNPDPAQNNNRASLVTTIWPLPVLAINLVRVSWPVPLSNFTLQ